MEALLATHILESLLATRILKDAPMGVMAVDSDGRIQSANATAERLFGEPLLVEPRLHISSILPTLCLDGLFAVDSLAEFNANGRSAGGTRCFEANRLDGGKLTIDVQASRLSIGDENHLTLFIHDYTPIIAAEAAMHDLRQQLFYRWRLNSLGEMASMVAHELNQPLAAIGNYLHVAKADLDVTNARDAKVHQTILKAENQAIRASDIIRHMRALLSRDTGYHALYSAEDIVHELEPLMTINCREVDAIVQFDIAAGENVRCDRIQIQQVIMNLSRNALEAVKGRRERCVQIWGRRVLCDRYEIGVDDSGAGISSDMAELLFEPLSSTKVDGMGLGLSICKTIVESHGGTLEYRESPLGGARFSFTIPRALGGVQ
jgi:two-component system, LuxR family, sensor kinase FixL